MPDFEFEFIISGINRVLAEDILNAIISMAETYDGQVGGGFHLVEEEAGDGEEA